MAETRCNTLKDQLDQMKYVYGPKRAQNEKFSEKLSDENPPALRQKSRRIATDASGAAVRTINNILNGITNSVNRLVEIHTPRIPPLEILPKKKPSKNIRKRILSKFNATEIVDLYRNEARTQISASEMSIGSKKTYNLPTVASKMKQTTKKYLRSVDLRTIPFCPAISTNQSHNIGINIQQVKNIIRNRQPIDGISPTLAHNIGLAAQTRPCAVKLSQKCPLSRKAPTDDGALREEARNLPEVAEEEEIGGDESDRVTSMFITGPSGDVEIKTKKTTSWKTQAETDQCTCAPDYQQKSKKRPKSMRTKSEAPLFGREKNLREVLSHLHADFSQMNRKYECLCQKSVNEKDQSTLPELENLEKELEKKEEEIGMVVALCKEVQALKRQVKQLKEKKSQASLALAEGKFNDYNHPEAAFHLTRLLKQIQHYQTRYKSNLEQKE